MGVVTSHVDRISDHLTRGDELAANAAQVHRSLSSIEQGFNVNNPQVRRAHRMTLTGRACQCYLSF